VKSIHLIRHPFIPDITLKFRCSLLVRLNSRSLRMPYFEERVSKHRELFMILYLKFRILSFRAADYDARNHKTCKGGLFLRGIIIKV
jgi:hypothetical protein